MDSSTILIGRVYIRNLRVKELRFFLAINMSEASRVKEIKWVHDKNNSIACAPQRRWGTHSFSGYIG